MISQYKHNKYNTHFNHSQPLFENVKRIIYGITCLSKDILCINLSSEQHSYKIQLFTSSIAFIKNKYLNS